MINKYLLQFTPVISEKWNYRGNGLNFGKEHKKICSETNQISKHQPPCRTAQCNIKYVSPVRTKYNLLFYSDVLLTVHLSIFISVFNQLDAQNLFHNKFISCLYMFRAHVLIIRKSKLHYTASGITPIGVMISEAV